jgi:hypothetical protein
MIVAMLFGLCFAGQSVRDHVITETQQTLLQITDDAQKADIEHAKSLSFVLDQSIWDRDVSPEHIIPLQRVRVYWKYPGFGRYESNSIIPNHGKFRTLKGQAAIKSIDTGLFVTDGMNYLDWDRASNRYSIGQQAKPATSFVSTLGSLFQIDMQTIMSRSSFETAFKKVGIEVVNTVMCVKYVNVASKDDPEGYLVYWMRQSSGLPVRISWKNYDKSRRLVEFLRFDFSDWTIDKSFTPNTFSLKPPAGSIEKTN